MEYQRACRSFCDVSAYSYPTYDLFVRTLSFSYVFFANIFFTVKNDMSELNSSVHLSLQISFCILIFYSQISIKRGNFFKEFLDVLYNPFFLHSYSINILEARIFFFKYISLAKYARCRWQSEVKISIYINVQYHASTDKLSDKLHTHAPRTLYSTGVSSVCAKY